MILVDADHIRWLFYPGTCIRVCTDVKDQLYIRSAVSGLSDVRLLLLRDCWRQCLRSAQCSNTVSCTSGRTVSYLLLLSLKILFFGDPIRKRGTQLQKWRAVKKTTCIRIRIFSCHLFVRLFVCPSVCPSVCLSVVPCCCSKSTAVCTERRGGIVQRISGQPRRHSGLLCMYITDYLS